MNSAGERLSLFEYLDLLLYCKIFRKAWIRNLLHLLMSLELGRTRADHFPHTTILRHPREAEFLLSHPPQV